MAIGFGFRERSIVDALPFFFLVLCVLFFPVFGDLIGRCGIRRLICALTFAG